MHAKNNKSGISLLEIVVAMMLLALVLIGLSNVFVASGGYLKHSRARISATQLSSVFVEPLQNEVRQSDWGKGSNNLSVGLRNPASVDIGGVNYQPTYNITDQTAGGSALRRVEVRIRWNETQ